MSNSSSSNNKKKRTRSMFDAVQQLNSQDAQAETKRRTSSRRAVARRQAALSQTKLYASLMECRILLQRSLHQPVVTPPQEEGEGDANTRAPAVDQCNELLTRLLEARKRYTAATVKKDDNADSSQPEYRVLVDSKDSTELESLLQKEYEDCRAEWKKVLNSRHDDVRLHAGLTAKAQFRVVDTSFWDQVEATKQHDELRHGQNKAEFDDSRLYQNMLKDFVASSPTGDAKAAQERLKQQQKSNKKQVDRRASKGRKIRYTEIPKLKNFTFPLSRSSNTGSNLDDEEFLSSLFGGAGNRS